MKKILININGGIGDAVLWIPIVAQLKDQNYKVFCVTQSISIKKLFDGFNNFDNVYLLNWKNLTFFLNSNNFNYIYLDLWPTLPIWIISLFNIRNLRILCNKKNKYTFVLSLLGAKRFSIHNLNMHMLRILIKYFQLDGINLGLLSSALQLKCKKSDLNRYIVIQLFSGDSLYCGKNLELVIWRQVIKFISENYINYRIVIMGNEGREIAQEIAQNFKALNLIGRTSLSEVVNLIEGCSGYIGLDSGLMHIAALYKKPTFTFWGPSSEIHYGYSQLDSKRHQDLRCEYICSPCESPALSNMMRFKNSNQCVDRRCMKNFDLDFIYEKLICFFENLEE